jgi:glycosyltransferase involved in cell wall biosynthesis
LNALKDLAEQLKLSVTFHGWLDNNSDELKSLFETSAIFALPSHAENFPLVLLEAMAAGMAIVTTDQTGCREVVGDAALLVPPGDHRAIRGALQRLAGDTGLRAQLGRKARARIEGLFSWPSVAQQYMSLFENLVSQNQRKAELSGVK